MGTEGMVTHPLGSVVLPPPYTHPLHAHFWGDKRRKSISVDISPKLRLKINHQPAAHFLRCRLSRETMQLKHLHVDTSDWSQLKGQIKTSPAAVLQPAGPSSPTSINWGTRDETEMNVSQCWFGWTDCLVEVLCCEAELWEQVRVGQPQQQQSPVGVLRNSWTQTRQTTPGECRFQANEATDSVHSHYVRCLQSQLQLCFY